MSVTFNYFIHNFLCTNNPSIEETCIIAFLFTLIHHSSNMDVQELKEAAELLELNELSFYVDSLRGKDDFTNSELKQRVQMVSTGSQLKYFSCKKSCETYFSSCLNIIFSLSISRPSC